MKTRILLCLAASAIFAHGQSQSVGPNGEGIKPGNRSNFLDALGGTTVGKNLFQLANPSAVRYLRLNADNSVEALNASDFLTSVGAISGSLYALKDGSDANVSGFRTRLSIENVNNTGDASKPVSTAQAAANVTDRARANHTGTQAWSTLTATPTTLAGYGISDAQPLSTNLTTWAGLASGNANTTTSIGNLTGVITSTNRATAIADAALSIAKTSGLQTLLDDKASLTADNDFTGDSLFEGESRFDTIKSAIFTGASISFNGATTFTYNDTTAATHRTALGVPGLATDNSFLGIQSFNGYVSFNEPTTVDADLNVNGNSLFANISTGNQTSFLTGATFVYGSGVAATHRTALGLAIDTNVQAYSANLDTWSGLASGNATTATAANGIKTATTTVSVSSATAPTSGQVLTATGTTAATWQTPSSTAAAGTLTGTTLASNVVNSSLTSAAGGAFGTAAYASTGTSSGNVPVLGTGGSYPALNGSVITSLNASNISSGTLADANISSAATWNAKQSALTFSTGLTNTGGTITVNAAQSQVTSVGTLTSLTTSGATSWTGTGGASYIDSAYQSSAPATPSASHTRFYFDATGRMTWKKPDGFTRTFDGASNTADRVYTLPDVTGTVITTGDTGSVTNAMLAGSITGAKIIAGTAASGSWDVASGGTGRATGTTAYGLIAVGTTATGAQQTLAAGATTEILVGGGASALPVWTTATGSGAPVRATAPTLAGATVSGAADGVPTLLFSGCSSGNSGIGPRAGGSNLEMMYNGVRCVIADANGGSLRDGSGNNAVSSGSRQLTGNWAVASGTFTAGNSTASTSSTTGALISSGGLGVAGDTFTGGKIVAGAQIRLKGYTVATLPASPTQGDTAFVTDALTPAFLVTIAGGGAVVTQVMYNGTNWVAQ